MHTKNITIIHIDIMKLISSISKIYKNNSIWSNLILVFFVIIIIRCLMNINRPLKEGFLYQKQYTMKTGGDIFDDFYANYYDDLTFNYSKNLFEIGEIITMSNLTQYSKVLDIGSGTGHHVAMLSEHNIPAIGLDSSNAMVEYAKKTYPKHNFNFGDALNSSLYSASSFSHILCLNFTMYYMQDKTAFLRNSMNWLMPGGYLVIHLVDKDSFNPIMPNGKVEFDKKLSETNSYTKTVMKLDGQNYTSDFLQDKNEPELYIMKEKFVDENKMVRENEHTLYMNTQKHILGLAKQEGYILLGKIDMSPIQYNYQYIYILQKPN